VLASNQNKILDYVRKNYENVSVLMKDNWMRLDFNHDGKVSFEDIRKGMTELFEFMKNFDFFNTAMDIKSTIYSEAIKLMKKDDKKEEKEEKEDKSDDKEDEDNEDREEEEEINDKEEEDEEQEEEE